MNTILPVRTNVGQNITFGFKFVEWISKNIWSCLPLLGPPTTEARWKDSCWSRPSLSILGTMGTRLVAPFTDPTLSCFIHPLRRLLQILQVIYELPKFIYTNYDLNAGRLITKLFFYILYTSLILISNLNRIN